MLQVRYECTAHICPVEFGIQGRVGVRHQTVWIESKGKLMMLISRARQVVPRRVANLVNWLTDFVWIRPRGYEEWVFKLLLQEGDVVFDVGANIGSVARFFSRLVGPTGSVYAFEPVWASFAEMCASVHRDYHARRGTIFPLQFGLAEQAGLVTFDIPAGYPALASMRPQPAWAAFISGGRKHQAECRVDTIDAFIARSGVPSPVFLKIDVEGAEFSVIRGAKLLLQSPVRPMMLVEVFAPWERQFGYTPWALFSYLRQFGYEVMFCCPQMVKRHNPTELQPFPEGFDAGYNVIFYDPTIHRERIARLQSDTAKKIFASASFIPPPVPNAL